MKKKIFGIFFILLTIFNLSALGTLLYNKYFTAQELPVKESVYFNTLKDSLNLSENQCGRMRECNICFKDNISHLSHKLKMHRNRLINYLKTDSTDINKINVILVKIDSLQSSLLREVVNNLLLHKEILTNEQRQKFFSMISTDTTISTSTNFEACCLNNKNNKKQE